jgi:hypothetical protein
MKEKNWNKSLGCRMVVSNFSMRLTTPKRMKEEETMATSYEYL